MDKTGVLDEQLRNLSSEVSKRETLHKECQKRFNRFQSIDGQPTCSYCGQPLTWEHLVVERQNIERELHETERIYQDIMAQYAIAQQEKQIWEKECVKIINEEKQQQRAIKDLTEQQSHVRSEQNAACVQVGTVLQMLSPEYIECIQGTTSTPIDSHICLQATYPLPQDIEALSAQLQEKEPLKQLSRVVEENLERRANLIGKQSYLLNEILPLEQTYPSERMVALLWDQEHTQQRNEELLNSSAKAQYRDRVARRADTVFR